MVFCQYLLLFRSRNESTDLDQLGKKKLSREIHQHPQYTIHFSPMELVLDAEMHSLYSITINESILAQWKKKGQNAN